MHTETKQYAATEAYELQGPAIPGMETVLTDEAIRFLIRLHQRFEPARRQILKARIAVQEQLDRGVLPDFLPDTASIRQGDWAISPLPPALLDRRVEITGPVDRKMVINALNSGASMFMADFEDSNTPSWQNLIQGQQNLQDAVRKTISLVTPEKTYRLHNTVATLLVRPRGWHMQEKHFLVEGTPISASLFDFGLFVFHNAAMLLEQGVGPFFYLPKTEAYQEARLWNEVFDFTEAYLSLPAGCIKATVLIETITAVFQLHEILYELRTHAAGFNCGRWDYIFSFIKKFRNQQAYVFPDRSAITMTVPFMRAYTQLVIQTCHRRNALAIGGMAAQIPIRDDEEANHAAMERVRADKLREVTDGHDGTWVAHPGLVPLAMQVFNEHMPTANQLHRKREDFTTSQAELLALPEGNCTEAGIRLNINVGIMYLESWLRGNGAAAIYHLMEDAATAEISRTQVWQWIRREVTLDNGRRVTPEYYRIVRGEELQKISAMVGADIFRSGRFLQAAALFDDLVLQEQFEEFLTTNAYQQIS